MALPRSPWVAQSRTAMVPVPSERGAGRVIFSVVKATAIWMPLYIGDYLADTIGLTLSQHGTYLLLIFAYWRNGGPLSAAEAKAVMRDALPTDTARIALFFRIEGGKWHHSRIDRELARAKKNHSSRVNACKVASSVRWKNHKKADASRMRHGCMTECVTDAPSPSPSGEGTPSLSDSPVVAKIQPSFGTDASPPPPPEGEPKSPSRFQKPSLEAVKLAMAKAGLPEDEAQGFIDYYESNGWRVGKNPMRSWQGAIGTWSKNYRQGRFQNSVSGNGKPLTPLDISTIIKAKERECQQLRLRYCSEVAMGDTWNDPKARQEFFKLKGEVKKLNHQLGAMA